MSKCKFVTTGEDEQRCTVHDRPSVYCAQEILQAASVELHDRLSRLERATLQAVCFFLGIKLRAITAPVNGADKSRCESEYEVISKDYSALKARLEDAEVLAKERGSEIVGLSCELENRTRQFENEMEKVRAFRRDLCAELCQPDGSPDEQWAHNELCVDLGRALNQDTKTCQKCESRGLEDCAGVGHKPVATRVACPGRVCLSQDEFHGLRTALKERDALLAASKLALRAYHATASDKARYCLNDDDDAEPYLTSKADVAGYRAIRAAIEDLIERKSRSILGKDHCPKCHCPWSAHDKIYGCTTGDAGGGSCGCRWRKIRRCEI